MDTTPWNSAGRIGGYLLRKKNLVRQVGACFAPAVGSLLSDLCTELRASRPDASDAMLVEMFLSNVGIDDEVMTACLAINENYLEHFGIGIQDHRLDVLSHDVAVTLRFRMANRLLHVVSRRFEESVHFLVQAKLGQGATVEEIVLVGAELLEMVDLENLTTVLGEYWEDSRLCDPGNGAAGAHLATLGGPFDPPGMASDWVTAVTLDAKLKCS